MPYTTRVADFVVGCLCALGTKQQEAHGVVGSFYDTPGLLFSDTSYRRVLMFLMAHFGQNVNDNLIRMTSFMLTIPRYSEGQRLL